MTAYERMDSLFDEGTFVEFDKEMISKNPLDFPTYEDKLESDRK